MYFRSLIRGNAYGIEISRHQFETFLKTPLTANFPAERQQGKLREKVLASLVDYRDDYTQGV
jgi:hypothetical protein